jgi:hypothetical protein
VACLWIGTARQLHDHSGIVLYFSCSLPAASPFDAIGCQNKLPRCYPDNHDDMCQTERQILDCIEILVLVRIDGVLPTPALSNLSRTSSSNPSSSGCHSMICCQRSSVSVIRLPQRSVTYFNGCFYPVCLRRPCNHLMTLSARNSTDCGIVRPICFAVFRLITNSNFVGCSTGRSAGFVPFRILST